MWNSGLKNGSGQRLHELLSLNNAEGNSEMKKWDSSPQTLVRESEPKVQKLS